VGLQRGEVRRHTLLGTEATYRVIGRERDGLVRVVVIDAPGLPAGRVLNLTADAVRSMERVAEPVETERGRVVRLVESVRRAS
jgi:hypothetical protein